MALSKVVVIVLAGYSVIASISGQEEKKGCKTENGTLVKVGEQYDVPGYCNLNVCKGNDEWTTAACGASGLPKGWSSLPEDPTRGGFPKCCPKSIPPLDVVPDVLDEYPGYFIVDINFDNDTVADMGNELTPTQVKSQPEVKYEFAEPDSWYLLAMVDPDAPSRQNPESREFLHWLLGNVPGSNFSKGETLAEYVSSGPPRDTGLHRYFFLLYKQPGKLTFIEPKINKTTAEGRRTFSIKNFAKKYDMGNPVAMNVYQAKYDDYVPEVHKQLGLLGQIP